jgi:integrase
MVPNPSLAAEVSAVITNYAPRSLRLEVARFARQATLAASPSSRARAKALLFAAGKLGSFGASVGLALSAEVLLRSSVIERFIVTDGAALAAPTRRTVRSNLRALEAAVGSGPGPVPLSRERAKAPYGPAEIDGYLALARAQPTEGLRMRASGLICLGAGAGLAGADLRSVRGRDVLRRSGGMVVAVGGRRPRTVPVLARHHEALWASATYADGAYVIGGRSPERRTVTTPLVDRLASASDLPRLDTGRLRATWLAACAERIGLGAFMEAAGITCSQRIGDTVATLAPLDEGVAVGLLGAQC